MKPRQYVMHWTGLNAFRLALAGIVALGFAGSLQAQLPPILGGPGSIAPGMFRPPPINEDVLFNDPRKAPGWLWDDRTVAYKQAFSIIPPECRKLISQFQGTRPEAVKSLEAIIGHAGVMDKQYDRLRSESPVWLTMPATDEFLHQVTTIAFGLKRLNDRINIVKRKSPPQCGLLFHDDIRSEVVARYFNNFTPGEIEARIITAITNVERDLQLKTNLHMCRVEIHATFDNDPRSNYKVHCTWIVEDDFQALFGRSNGIRDTFPGYSSPTTPAIVPAGWYICYGKGQLDRGPKTKIQYLQVSTNAPALPLMRGELQLEPKILRVFHLDFRDVIDQIRRRKGKDST